VRFLVLIDPLLPIHVNRRFNGALSGAVSTDHWSATLPYVDSLHESIPEVDQFIVVLDPDNTAGGFAVKVIEGGTGGVDSIFTVSHLLTLVPSLQLQVTFRMSGV
jgi:hypothetical protein